ncbi:MAG: hypothetical protein WC955_05060 [Elusimicrobiota bacterium]
MTKDQLDLIIQKLGLQSLSVESEVVIIEDAEPGDNLTYENIVITGRDPKLGLVTKRITVKKRFADGMVAESQDKTGYCIVHGPIILQSMTICPKCHQYYCISCVAKSFNGTNYCEDCCAELKAADFKDKLLKLLRLRK